VKAKMAISLMSVLTATSLFAAGCGGSSSTSTTTAGNAATAGKSESRPTEGQEAGGAVPSEAQSAATGDIPDNQVFLTFHDSKAGYSVRYPEGWARKGSGSDVTFQEKANVIHVVVTSGAPQSLAAASVRLARLKRADPTVRAGKPQQVTISGAPVIKVTYTRLSSPDPVTGKRLPLTIDRYVYAHGGKLAVVDLGTPEGVDNVDAYRMISKSFRWQR
jgi:hypothetical protein